MWAAHVVKSAPVLHDEAGYSYGVYDIAIERLASDAGVEALDIAHLPRAPWLAEIGICADGGDPALNRLCNELQDTARRGMLRRTPENEEVGEDVGDFGRLELPVDP